jgi:drug/metabolite transporter (DMT)-like permease
VYLPVWGKCPRWRSVFDFHEIRLFTSCRFALVATLLLWSSAYAGIRAGLKAYSPAHLALLRFLVASLVLGLSAGIAYFRRPKRRDIGGIALSGAVGITFYNLALNYGETRVDAGAASLLIASTPIWTALLATITLGERLTIRGWGGVLMSFAGVALIVSGAGEGIHFSPQALIVLAAAVSSAIYIVLQKHFLSRYNPLEFTAYTIWAGTLLLLPWGRGLFQVVRGAPYKGTLAVVYLGVFPGALAYVAWAYVLGHGTAGRMSSFLYLTPVLAIAMAWLWLGEVPNMLSLIGGAVALAGVVSVSLWGKTTPAAIDAAACDN